MRNLVLLLAVVFAAGLSAQDSLEIGPIYAVSDTALVVVGRRDELATRLPYAVESVNAAAITRAQSLTTADALADLSGVYVQKSQFGGGSPVVRGFEANRVLLVVDGVRLNNAIYRAGHLQNAISVDPLALDRLEVIYGAGALAYGSDAIGGVIHFRTLQPNFLPSPEERGRGRGHTARTQDAMSGKVSVAYGTAARALSVGGRLSYGAERWAGLTLLSTSQTSHLRAGAQRPDRYPAFGLRNEYLLGDNVVPNDDPNVQIGTAYAQYNLLQKLRFRLNDRLELDANFQFSTTSNVPRYDALTERRNGQLRWAQWDYGPQTRTLASLRLQDRRPTALYDLATYLLSHQFVEEDRLQRRAGDPLREHNLTNVRVVNLQTDFSKILGLTTLRYGFDARYDQVDSEAFLQDISLPGSRRWGNGSPAPAGGYPVG
ncbi:MAG: TonB-dependent receptor plug domain-containing protein [Bacteroidota bacterium]